MIRSTITKPHRSSSRYTYNGHSLSLSPQDILISDQDRDDHSIHSDDTVLSMPFSHAPKPNINRTEPQHTPKRENRANKLIQCGACFRSFHTQAQFGQHSRICREGKAVIRHLIQSRHYKYAFLEKQTKQKLEVKSRFVIDIQDSENWKKISRKTGLYDGAIKKMLQSKDIKNVDVAVRQRRASGLIIANFMVRNVSQNAKAIHTAKSSIERAVDNVYHQLPRNIEMRLHLCKSPNCQELVIRDTEGFCSRHRAQKYHQKNHTHKVYKCENNEKQKQKYKQKDKRIRQLQQVPPQIHKPASIAQVQLELMQKDENNGTYDALLKHLKATAPTKPTQANTSLVQTDNVNNISIKEDGSSTNSRMTEDDEIVAQILTNLRATCTKANSRKRVFTDMGTQPNKKRKWTNDRAPVLSNDATIYMVPVYPISIPMQPMPSIPYALVPIQNHNAMNVLNSLTIPPLPPIASFCNVQTEDMNEDPCVTNSV